MQYEIIQMEAAGYWQVKYFGDVTEAIREAAFKEHLNMIQGQELYGVLIDFTVASLKMSLFGLYDFTNLQTGSGKLYRVKVAFLYKQEDAERGEFHALAMNNRGLIADVFTDRSAAIEWLLDATSGE